MIYSTVCFIWNIPFSILMLKNKSVSNFKGVSRIMDYTTKWSLKLTMHLVEILLWSLLNCRCFMRCVCIYRISAVKVSQLLSNGDIRVARTSKWWITQCSKVLVKMNKWNYNKNIKYNLFLDRISHVSAVSCTDSVLLSCFRCASNNVK